MADFSIRDDIDNLIEGRTGGRVCWMIRMNPDLTLDFDGDWDELQMDEYVYSMMEYNDYPIRIGDFVLGQRDGVDSCCIYKVMDIERDGFKVKWVGVVEERGYCTLADTFTPKQFACNFLYWTIPFNVSGILIHGSYPW